MDRVANDADRYTIGSVGVGHPGLSLVTRLLVLVLLLAASPAWALDTCFTRSIGPWRGPVWNGPGIQTMDAEFHAAADGTLVGSYHVHDAVPFDGSLTGFRETGPCEAEFTWNDRYGTGVVRVRFQPDQGRFLGHWGGMEPNPDLIFNGYRVGPPATS